MHILVPAIVVRLHDMAGSAEFRTGRVVFRGAAADEGEAKQNSRSHTKKRESTSPLARTRRHCGFAATAPNHKVKAAFLSPIPVLDTPIFRYHAEGLV